MAKRGQHTATAVGSPKMMEATANAYAEGPTTLVQVDPYKFVIDEPPKLGGGGLGANPLTHLLGGLMACSQYTLNMISAERRLPISRRAMWSAQGDYDLQGIQGVEGLDARFQNINLRATLDTDASQDDLNTLVEAVRQRCILVATCAASGANVKLSFTKGSVDHDCPPACELHNIEKSGRTTGVVTDDPGKHADAPQPENQGKQSTEGRPKTGQGYHTSAVLFNNGEDVARKNLGEADEPQIQKQTSEQGAPETAGGAYASRDSPRAQAAPPTEGKSNGDLVKEQTAGATPQGETGAGKEASTSDANAERSLHAARSGKSPLGQQPHGEE